MDHEIVRGREGGLAPRSFNAAIRSGGNPLPNLDVIKAFLY